MAKYTIYFDQKKVLYNQPWQNLAKSSGILRGNKATTRQGRSLCNYKENFGSQLLSIKVF